MPGPRVSAKEDQRLTQGGFLGSKGGAWEERAPSEGEDGMGGLKRKGKAKEKEGKVKKINAMKYTPM